MGGADGPVLAGAFAGVDRDAVSTAATSHAPSLPSGPVAGLFPGQGSQAPGMRDMVAELAPELLAQCLELVGDDPFLRVAESTRYAQPAIFCASVASWIGFEQSIAHGEIDGAWRPTVFAGHSLGELAALVAAGSLSPQAALRLAVRRGALMAESGERDGGGGLVALLGAGEEQCEQLAAAHGATIANDNAPGQLVLAGSKERLGELVRGARELGVRAIALDVAGAFHSPAMAAAVEPFRDVLDEVEVSTPREVVISCASAQPIKDVRSELAQAIVRPVRWRETMLRLAEHGASEFLDLGPGKVLAGLVVRNLPGTHGVQVATLSASAGSVDVAA